MKSHGKSKAVLSAIIFEVNLLQSSRFGETKQRREVFHKGDGKEQKAAQDKIRKAQ